MYPIILKWKMLSRTREAWILINGRGNKNNVTLHTKSKNEIRPEYGILNWTQCG